MESQAPCPSNSRRGAPTGDTTDWLRLDVEGPVAETARLAIRLDVGILPLQWPCKLLESTAKHGDSSAGAEGEALFTPESASNTLTHQRDMEAVDSVQQRMEFGCKEHKSTARDELDNGDKNRMDIHHSTGGSLCAASFSMPSAKDGSFPM